MKKLNNDNFVKNAPEKVVKNEEKKDDIEEMYLSELDNEEGAES